MSIAYPLPANIFFRTPVSGGGSIADFPGVQKVLTPAVLCILLDREVSGQGKPNNTTHTKTEHRHAPNSNRQRSAGGSYFSLLKVEKVAPQEGLIKEDA